MGLIQNGIPGVRTLAIGDGANDVAMIQAANIGVGIKGEEGLQAVNSSDYAIAQFRYLASLLLKHGRWNYIRMSHLICYMFYKNVFMSLGQWWFNFVNGWGGQKYYNEGAIQMFNLLYTSVPIIILAFYDTDITSTSCFRFAEDYKACIRNEHFTSFIFWNWLVSAIMESLICSIIPIYFLQNSDADFGTQSTFWNAGSLCFTCTIIICNMKLFFIQVRWHWIHAMILSSSILLWWLTAFFFNAVPDSLLSLDAFWPYYWTFFRLNANLAFWCILVLICTIIIGKDIYFCALNRLYNFSNREIIQEYEKMHELSTTEIEESELRKGLKDNEKNKKDADFSIQGFTAD